MGKTIKEIIKKPSLLFLTGGHRELFNWMSDKKYLEIAYKICTGLELNLDNPNRYNEKIQWLKLYDRNPRYTKWVDKYEAKKLASEVVGEEYIIPTIGVWDTFDQIDFGLLPDKFVLKCTHDSGGIVICTDKSKLDIKKTRKKINKCLKHNFYWGQREWPYKDVKPRIIAEQYMIDRKTGELPDYKFFCFDGEVKALFIATERQKLGEDTKFDFFDSEFNHLPFTNGHPNAHTLPEKPENFELMKQLARKLSKDIPHVRVDLYEINGKVYFGELTFAHWSGLMPFEPEEWDYTFGSWINLPKGVNYGCK